ncbi:MAG: hypothetical protein ACFE8G_06125 [Candidatus Hermodarchaeota archaeon]
MTHEHTVYESTKRALANFENIKESIQGLYDILKITLNSESIYFNMGQDNIEALYENLLELMVNELGAIEFIKKIKSAEIDLDLPLDNLSK